MPYRRLKTNKLEFYTKVYKNLKLSKENLENT